jgi:hypothetical protein
MLWSTMHDRALAAARATVSVHFFPPVLNALFDARDAARLLWEAFQYSASTKHVCRMSHVMESRVCAGAALVAATNAMTLLVRRGDGRSSLS